MKKTIFITGASAGFGEAFAWKLASEGHNLILSARSMDKLKALKTDILKKYANVSVDILEMDVQKKEVVKKQIESLGGKGIDVLVNNAGLALSMETMHEGDVDEWDTMIDTNIKGLLYVTRFLAPSLLKSKCGHIVNIGSIAGDAGYKGGGVYCATKAAVDILSEAMRIELVATPLKVSVIKPGMAETNFSNVRFAGNEEKASSVYKGIDPLTPSDLAEILSFVINTSAHVQIGTLTVTPTNQADAFHTHRKV